MFSRRLRCSGWIRAWWAIALSLSALLGSTSGFSSGSSGSSSSYLSCSYSSVIGDGDCDSFANNEECGYDGGDCCSCTCIDNLYECGTNGFLCNDPSATCFGEDEPVSTTTVSATDDYADEGECRLDWISDGFCDSLNNTEDCRFDGGDCCVCTCVTADYDCTSGFNCVDPEADCTEGVRTGEDGSCTDSIIGNGQCDGSNNNAECLFDGGDCCSGKRCNSDDCIDPNSHCSGTVSTKPSLQTRSRSNLMKVFVGVGAGCVGLVIAACLAMRCVNVMLEKRRKRKAQEAPATTVEQ